MPKAKKTTETRKKRSFIDDLKFEFRTIGLVMIPIAIGINWVGGFFAQTLRLPVWLDTIGTMLGAVIGGPWLGAVIGALTNLIKWITFDPVAGPYAVVNIAIGLITGYAYKTKMFREDSKWPTILGIGVLLALVATVTSVPITILVWGGVTGSGADAVAWVSLGFQGFQATTGGDASAVSALWIAVFLGEFVTDVLDKILSMFIIVGVLKKLPVKYKGL